MAYSRTTWQDSPSTATPITATRLNNIEAMLASIANAGDAWTTYTPALTASTSNPNLGTTGSITGRYIQVGKTVTGEARLSFGGSSISAGSGAYSVSIPVTASSSNRIVGSWFGQDQSTGARQTGIAFTATVTTLQFPYTAASGFPLIGNGTPWTWADSDLLWVQFTYEAA